MMSRWTQPGCRPGTLMPPAGFPPAIHFEPKQHTIGAAHRAVLVMTTAKPGLDLTQNHLDRKVVISSL